MSDCKKCADVREENKPEVVSRYVYDLEQARSERHSRRWMIAFFVALAMVFATNVGWLIYESQFAEEFDMSERQIKNIVYKCTDRLSRHV